jgi:hypothetical protein
MDRRDFITRASLSIGAAMLAPSLLAQEMTPKPKSDKPQKPLPFSPELVSEFVKVGHNNLTRVKEMLADHPNLLYATWDGGGGDFETGLEGAGHVGDKDIANYLIGQGARPNIFVLTMLGKTAIVKPILEAFPQLLSSKGPHGYTLLHHAERGEEDAAELLEYIQSQGLKEKKFSLY